MKEQVKNYIRSLGGLPHYSGKTKTMHITEPKDSFPYTQEKGFIEIMVIDKFGYALKFRLHTN